jgi:hypothetical protein
MTAQEQIKLLTKAISVIGSLLIGVLAFSGAMFHNRLSAIETILMDRNYPVMTAPAHLQQVAHGQQKSHP